MTTTNYAVVIRDAITGRQLGTLNNYGSIVRDAIVGDRIGRLAPAVTASQIRDAITGDRIGSHLSALGIMREVLSGEDIGLDLFPQMMSTIREVIGRDTSYKFVAQHREILIASPDEWVSIYWENRTLRELVNQRRPTMKTPPNVWSYTPIPSYVEIVSQRQVRAKPISMHNLQGFTSLALQERGTLAPPGMLSKTRAGMFRELVLQSRSIPYVPASGNFVPTLRQVALQERTPPAAVRSPIRVAGQQQIVALSKRDDSRYAATLVQIALVERLVLFSAPTDYAGFFEMLAQQRINPMWHSTSTAATLQELTLQHRDTWIPLSFTIVPSYNQVLAQNRDLPWWHSTSSVGAVQQITLQVHDVVRYWSDLFVPALQQITLQHFVPGPLPPTPMYVQPFNMLAAQQRDVLPPNKISWWYASTATQITAQANVQPFPLGVTEVATLRVQYVLAKDYPLPEDVMGPENGVIIPSYHELAVQHRHVEPPHLVNESRYVFNIGEQVAMGDRYPNPVTPVSDVIVQQIGQVVVIDDFYTDPALPQSDAVALQVATQVAMGDVYPDPLVPLSDAVVMALQELAVLGDVFPDPLLPSSELQALQVGQQVAMGDAGFLDPTLPLSDVLVTSLAAPVVIGDTSYPLPTDAMSTLDALSIAEFVIMVDRTLYGIPKRADRRRPIVSVSIT